MSVPDPIMGIFPGSRVDSVNGIAPATPSGTRYMGVNSINYIIERHIPEKGAATFMIG